MRLIKYQVVVGWCVSRNPRAGPQNQHQAGEVEQSDRPDVAVRDRLEAGVLEGEQVQNVTNHPEGNDRREDKFVSDTAQLFGFGTCHVLGFCPVEQVQEPVLKLGLVLSHLLISSEFFSAGRSKCAARQFFAPNDSSLNPRGIIMCVISLRNQGVIRRQLVASDCRHGSGVILDHLQHNKR